MNTAFKKTYLYIRLSKWLDVKAEYEFRIQYLDRSRNVVADYFSHCTSVSNDDAEKERLDVEQFFEHKEEENNGAIEMFLVATENQDMENFLRTIRSFIRTADGVGVAVRLHRQAKAYIEFQTTVHNSDGDWSRSCSNIFLKSFYTGNNARQVWSLGLSDNYTVCEQEFLVAGSKSGREHDR